MIQLRLSMAAHYLVHTARTPKRGNSRWIRRPQHKACVIALWPLINSALGSVPHSDPRIKRGSALL